MCSSIELTILMPCLNEENTIGICIKKAMMFLKENGIDGEVLVADNGSTDNSKKVARELGARVINVHKIGYGAALRCGNKAARGKYVIMGDADNTYDFYNLMPFLEKLREGNELVIGNRFMGGIDKGAMPFIHRYVGNPLLSWIGRKLYHTDICDFHCGLRGYNLESIRKLHLHTCGMEFASEMVVQAAKNDLRITQVPIRLKKDRGDRTSHLNTWADGWRHLKYLIRNR